LAHDAQVMPLIASSTSLVDIRHLHSSVLGGLGGLGPGRLVRRGRLLQVDELAQAEPDGEHRHQAGREAEHSLCRTHGAAQASA
jgi:hypothetical protein